MAIPPQVTMEWRRGADGLGGTYTFDPIPQIQRNTPNSRQAIFTLPLADGAIIQELGIARRTITLQGVLFTIPLNFNNLDQLRKDLATGIGSGPGQLHLIAPGNHVFYKAIPSESGIEFRFLERSIVLDYIINLTTPDPAEFVV